MLTPKNHPLVRVDFLTAYDWYETESAGLGKAFADEFRAAYKKLRSGPELYAVRFYGIRRLNLERFPYGLFYTVQQDEIRVLALLHGRRETKEILSMRRRIFLPYST
jgi:toxin ParE1/3/4